ncbi:MAG: DUF3486 family protein [Geobacter sp.]|nr:MAG: DUF3486 family protein [Geobacter sp.]
MGKRSELEPRAIDLFASGVEIPQISVELGVSENSLREWKKRAGTEWDDARAAFRKGMIAPANFEDVGQRVARAREITARVNGNAANQGKMGMLLNESLQTMLYDVMCQMQTSDLLDLEAMEASIEQMKGLAVILQRTEQAANLNLKREKEIRQQALEDAAKAVETTGKQAGISPETIEIIRRDVLRIAS